MGKTTEHPRYNVLSCRVDDIVYCLVRSTIGDAMKPGTIQEYLHAAIEEKLARDRQATIDNITRGHNA